MKLYVEAGDQPSPQTQLARLVARLMQIEAIQTVEVAADDEKLQKKSLTGRFPVLEDSQGCASVLISDGLPIARYLARANSAFCQGSTLQQNAQVDSWTDYIQGSVVPVASRVLDMISGKVACDRMTFSQTQNQLKTALAPINEHLLLRNFLVGHSLTIADALLVSTLARCFELFLDKKTRDSSLQNLSRYTTLILKMGPFARSFGAVTFCKDMTQPNYSAEKGGGKPQQAQGQQQAAAAKPDKGSLKIKVKTLARGEQEYTVKGSDTVTIVKQMLQESNKGLEAEATRLLLGGKNLADKQTMQACKVKAGDVIHAVRIMTAKTAICAESRASQ